MQSIIFGDEFISCLPSDEFTKIVRPRIRDTGAIGDDEYFHKSHLTDKVVGSQGLAETRFGIPQKFLAALFKIGFGHFDRLFLFAAQFVCCVFLFGVNAHAPRKIVEILQGSRPVQLEPFRTGAAGAVRLRFEIGMEIVIGEIFPRPVFIHGVIFPRKYGLNARCMRLLADALLHRLLFGVADLRPAVVVRHAGRIVGIHHGDDAAERLNIRCHHFISLTCVSINSISRSSSPYLAYN